MSDVTVSVWVWLKNKLEHFTALPISIFGHQEESHVKKTHKVSMMFALSLLLLLSLCADVNPSRKLFQPPSPLDCCSVDSDLALSTSQKWSNVHTQCLRNPFLLATFLYNSSRPLCLNWLKFICVHLIYLGFSGSNYTVFLQYLLFWCTLAALQNVLSYSCSKLGKIKCSELGGLNYSYIHIKPFSLSTRTWSSPCSMTLCFWDDQVEKKGVICTSPLKLNNIKHK